MTPRRIRLLVPAAVLAVSVGMAGSSAAEPATPVGYPAGAAPARYAGAAFDTCTAPSLATMTAWQASPYRAVGVYVAGASRSCAQPNLTRSWVTSVTGAGWKLIPIVKDRQPPCGGRPADPKIDPATAAAQGAAVAGTAVAAMGALGMLVGSAAYLDIENYATGDATCRKAVLDFASGWTRELHRRGYVAGVYVNLASGAKDFADAYTSTSYARPDAVWVARWDSSATLTGLAGVPDAYWSNHQRAKQYRGDHSETYGGVTLTIDTDRFDAPVASVARSYVTSAAVTARTAPAASATPVATYPRASGVAVACQTSGGTVAGSAIWDKLTDGSYVPDAYVRTGYTGYTPALPRCWYPYQVTASDGLNVRTGPGTSYPVRTTLLPGALAWVSCQRPGTTSGSTAVWDRLDTGGYVSDRYLATPGSPTYSAPIPHC